MSKLYFTRLLCLLIGVSFIASCAKEIPDVAVAAHEGDRHPSGPVITKIINSGVRPEKGTLIIYVDASACLDSARLDDGFVSRLDSLGVVSHKRLFDYVPATEERLRKMGMHRWYILSLAEDEDPTALAYTLSKESKVVKIQYDVRMQRQIVGSPKPCNIALDRPVGRLSGALSENISAPMTFNDAGLRLQWHYSNSGGSNIAPTAKKGADINVTDAWRLTAGDPSVVVAVVDEGVMYSHPDLADNMWVNEREKYGVPGVDDDRNGYVDDVYGYNFADDGPVTWDKKGDVGHGTHVAGTVAAVNNNGVGVCGVAGGTGRGDGVRLMSCQILSGNEGGRIDAAVNAIRYAADNGASILQCSFGYHTDSFKSDDEYEKEAAAELDAIRYFIKTKNCDSVDGGVVIFAAGNDGMNWACYPGGYTDVIAVTSIAADNCPAYYTNYGAGCNIAAPGGEYFTGGTQEFTSLVLSTTPKGLVVEEEDGSTFVYDSYGYMQGTSMACPHVSGVAALGLSYAKKLGKKYSLQEFKSMLLTSVNDVDRFLSGSKYVANGFLPLNGYKYNMGTGYIDAWKLMMQIEGTPTLVARINDYNRLNIKEYMGKGSENITYIAVDISPRDMDAIGLKESPVIKSGRLVLYPTKVGSAKMTVRAVGGGAHLGTPGQMGGFEISKEISVITREVASNNGGWL